VTGVQTCALPIFQKHNSLFRSMKLKILKSGRIPKIKNKKFSVCFFALGF
jgi:hypothetical protein